ncbi:hypothetical protein OsJ_12027 [Oryza sativa Japonica Group]|uniref:Uncharacterized protein n=1 Tax=Oryza sativa subsp. japonica TaxID=39947 RepID=B9FA72_ORYSJ|nr:hypothetical protein OsJ_12027 [Oryza sativa Japonica Group]
MAVDAHHLHRLPPPIQPAESMFSPRQPCFGAAAGEVVSGGAGGAVMAGLCQEEQLVQGYRQVFVGGGGVRQAGGGGGDEASTSQIMQEEAINQRIKGNDLIDYCWY